MKILQALRDVFKSFEDSLLSKEKKRVAVIDKMRVQLSMVHLGVNEIDTLLIDCHILFDEINSSECKSFIYAICMIESKGILLRDDLLQLRDLCPGLFLRGDITYDNYLNRINQWANILREQDHLTHLRSLGLL